jgi:DNA-binding NtrC family response regulator
MRDVLAALRLLLKGEGYAIETVQSPARRCAPSRLGVRRRADGSQLRPRHDLRARGLDLLERLRALDPALPVVVMTAWGSVDLAVEAMRRGARDFVQKPWDNARCWRRSHAGRARPGAAPGRRLEAENRRCAPARAPPSRGRGRLRAARRVARHAPVLELIERVGRRMPTS